MRIGTLYFDGSKLKEWAGQGQQTMALFEKIKTVGKGECAWHMVRHFVLSHDRDLRQPAATVSSKLSARHS